MAMVLFPRETRDNHCHLRHMEFTPSLKMVYLKKNVIRVLLVVIAPIDLTTRGINSQNFFIKCFLRKCITKALIFLSYNLSGK